MNQISKALSGFLLLSPCLALMAKDERPNILFILADDLSAKTLGCVGDALAQTPVIDKLASQGNRFRNAFVTTSISMASRASLFTGMYMCQHGVTDYQSPMPIEKAENTYPIRLKDGGYSTGFIGKFGFKIENNASPENWFDYYKPINQVPAFITQADGSEKHITATMADNAIEFLRTRDKKKPFCLSVSFHDVHAIDGDLKAGRNVYPYQKETEKLYENTTFPKPALSDTELFKSQPEFMRNSENRIRYMWRFDTPEKYQENMRAYYRMLAGMDNTIGKVLAELKNLKLDKNTIIVFMSDNGYFLGDRGFADKWNHYEESLRVPLVIYDPRLSKRNAGKVIEKMALNIDIPSTFLDWARLPIPQTYMGVSLKNMIENPLAVNQKSVEFYCEHGHKGKTIPKWRGVRGERYVYANYFEHNYEYLHDLDKDPNQLKNLAQVPEYQNILKEYRTKTTNYYIELSKNKQLSPVQKNNNSNDKIVDMQVERLQNPIGIDKENLRFAWKIISFENNLNQTNYNLSVSKSETDFENNLVWESGKIESEKQFDVLYNGKKLESNTAYFWRVDVNTSNGKLLSSAISKFHIGLLNQKEWVAQWIISGDSSTRAPYFRKTFKAKKNVKSAYAYVTGQGYFVFFTNGKRIGNEVLAPAPSQYERRSYYSVFDVTSHIQKGSNALGLLLGEGQSASTMQKPERFHNVARIYPGKISQPLGIVQLMIEYEDGTKETITTDESWKWEAGPITYNAFYGGEDYNANLELKGWNTVKYNDKNWKNCQTTNFQVQLSNSFFPPIRVVDELKPVITIKSNDSVYLYDLGQNIGGWWKLKVKGKSGSVVEITGAETLNNQDFPKKLEQGDVISTIYSHGLGGFYERDAKSIYTLKGSAEETYEPNFFYSGFRYIQVKLKNPKYITSHSVLGCTTHSDMLLQGSFECSDPVLNQLHKNTIWSIKSIAQGAPMSNPNSEKYGWTGDAHLYAEPTNLLFGSQNFWEKWLDDIRDAQLQYNTGNVVSTVPNYRRDITTTSPTWGAAYPLCTWYNYVFYADTTLLEKQYEGLQAWCKHLDSRAKNYLVPGVWADHVSPGFLDGKIIQRAMSKESAELVASTYYFVAHNTMSKIASILGRKKDVLFHSKQVDAIKNAINKKYFDEDKKCYVVPPAPEGYFAEQTANLLPLQYKIVPEEHRKDVLNFVIEDLKLHKNHLTTGIMGTKALVDVLPEEGFAELFYEVATQKTYPGWGFWIEKGATTHWQHWSGFPDHNHAMFGSIENFIISNVGGIRIPSENENTIGYKMVNIKPLLIHKLSYAKTSVPSPYGMISCNWKREGLNVTMEIEIPFGSSGNVILPNSISNIRINGVDKAVQTNYAISSGRFTLNFKLEKL